MPPTQPETGALSEFLRRRGDLIKQLVSGSSWSLAAGLIALFFGLLSVVLVARVLGVEVYGELGMLQSTVGMLAILATFGLNLTLTKHIAEFAATDKERAGRIYGVTCLFALLSGSILCLLTWAFAEYFAVSILDASHLALPLLLFAPVLVLDAWQAAQLGTLAGLQLFKNVALIEILRAAAQCTVVVACAFQWGLVGAVAGLLITRVIVSIASTRSVHIAMTERGIAGNYRDCLQEAAILRDFSLPAALSGLAVAPVMWLCNAMLVRQSGGFAALGVYNAANQVVTAITVLGESVSKPLLPMLVAHSGRGNFMRMVNILLPWAVGACLSVPLLLFPETVGLVFGSGYAGPVFEHTLAVVLIVVCLQLYMRAIGREVVARGMVWFNFWSNTFWAIVVLGIAAFLVEYGALGLALSYLFGYAVNLVVFIPFYRRHGLVPREALFSVWPLLLWTILLISAASGLLIESILVQFLVMLVALALMLFAIWKMTGFSTRITNV